MTKAANKVDTVPLSWKEVYYTNCPMVPAGDIDREPGRTRGEFNRIGMKYAYFRAGRENSQSPRSVHGPDNLIGFGGLFSPIHVHADIRRTRLLGVTHVCEGGCMMAQSRNDIRRMTDLKGKRIGFSKSSNAVNGDWWRITEEQGIELMLMMNGMARDDAEIVEFPAPYDRYGGPGTLESALEKGIVDAIYTRSVVFRELLEATGKFKAIQGLSGYPESTPQACNIPAIITCTREMAEQHPGHLVAYMKSMITAGHQGGQHTHDAAAVLDAQTFCRDVGHTNRGIEPIGLMPNLSPWNLAAIESAKNFMLSHGYIRNDFDVHEWAAPEFLGQAAEELVEEGRLKVTADRLPGAPVPRRSPRAMTRKPGRLGRLLKAVRSIVMVAALAVPAVVSAADASRRPNIVIILCDDLGFADMGAFGSEIKTPNLDSLARDGVRFTNFYTHATCSPTRSVLLTGVDTHLNGLGNMDEWTAPNQTGVPGYEGFINNRVVTMPQLLKAAGYHTYMVGKWHLGKAPDQIPAARGFERDFTLLDGAGSYWDMTNFTAASPMSVYTEDGRYLTRLPRKYYATKTYTDKLIGYIDANRGDGKPFFAYVAHQAPHDPYHLPKEWRSRHVGEYDKGWDAIRQERLKRQIELGIMPAGTQLAERMYFLPDPVVLAPASRAILGKKMELYAGMVENLDHHVGRLIDHLKKIGEYDNTIFIVFGDNGAEGTDLFKMIAGSPGTLNYLFAASHWSQTNPNAWGDPGSYVGYGPMWAQVSMTPFSQYKGWTAEGGIRNALIVSGPVVQRPKGSVNHGLMHVGDIMPTLLSIAGASYPKTSAEGQELPALMGKPWNDVLAGRAESPRTDQDYLAWEIFGNRAVRQGDWKLRWQFKPYGTGDWELYNVTTDPGERRNVAAQNPEKFQALLALWDSYAKANNVILPNRGPYETLAPRYDQLPVRVPVDEGFPALIYQRQFVPPADMLAEPKP